MTTEAKYYEISYLVKPTVSQEEAEGVDTSLRDLLADLGAVLESWDGPKRKRLAYPIEDAQEAFFGALRFNAAKDQISSIEGRLRDRKDLMRFMLLHWKKAPQRTAPRIRRPIEKEEQVPTDEKALDEKLEEIFKGEETV
jgi:small subunit ribosomal protein S6